MALPNFRLFQTQARWSVYLAAVATFGLVGLTVVVFKNFDWDTRNIYFDARPPHRGQYRVPIIRATAPVVVLLGLFAAGLGYSSLGQRRNRLQTWSWVGLLVGALCAALAVLDLIAWTSLSLQRIAPM